VNSEKYPICAGQMVEKEVEIINLRADYLNRETRDALQYQREFIETETESGISEDDISHLKTRQLLSDSKNNWANDIIADRKDRI
jgi:hypothetical protein